MKTGGERKIHRVVLAVLYPLVRICLRHMIGIRELVVLAKQAYVNQASKMILKNTRKVNVSRISAMTGIHRKELGKLLNEEEGSEAPVGIVARVVGRWQQDRKYCGANGRPRALSVEGESPEFRSLVSEVSSDLNPGTVLFELERLGIVERKGDTIRLSKGAVVETKSPEAAIVMLGQDINDLTDAVFENVDSPSDLPNLHGRTEYDNIAIEDLPKVKRLLLEEGIKFHNQAREIISKFDRDLNPKPGSRGRIRVALVAYSFTEKMED